MTASGPQPEALDDTIAAWEVAKSLREAAVDTVCQPIISLRDARLTGFEALSRPICDPSLAAPDVFLSVARTVGLDVHADRVWRRLAVERLGPAIPGGALLFLNVNPSALSAGEFRAAAAGRLVRGHGLSPERVVLELTEEETITDFASIGRTLSEFRSEGFLLAIDDAGAGPSSLRSVVELMPDFIKLDKWLTGSIQADPGRQAMVRSLIDFAHRTQARVVAEGIESPEELQTIVELGVDLGQGYLFGRPAPAPAPIEAATIRLVSAANRRASRRFGGGSAFSALAALSRPLPIVGEAASVDEVIALFREDGRRDAVAVMRGGALHGLATRTSVLQLEPAAAGIQHRAWRTAADFAVPAATIQGSATLAEAMDVALRRPRAARHDPLVLVDDAGPIGAIDVLDIVSAVSTATGATLAA